MFQMCQASKNGRYRLNVTDLAKTCTVQTNMLAKKIYFFCEIVHTIGDICQVRCGEGR